MAVQRFSCSGFIAPRSIVKNLNVTLNESLRVISMASAENKSLRQLLDNEQQTTKDLAATNQQQRSILSSTRLSFLWRLCNSDTLQCSRCLPGWAEHDSRCFFLSSVPQKWEVARRECLDMGGDLAVVSSAADQAFLTNMTFQYVRQHPQEDFLSAWIGLQDMVKEGAYFWVSGLKLHSNVTYWRPQEPNNAIAQWEADKAGQDCVTIVPPDHIGTEDWLNSWDDIVCLGQRHFLCETAAFILV
uniref:C-type lectin domain-containing protein n=1 Tax=Salarias fasciatus TaxID=181472 RepID=A0A672IM08_SALFA